MMALARAASRAGALRSLLNATVPIGAAAANMHASIDEPDEQRMDNTTTTLWDLYREIHKAMRYALFGVTTLAGQTDAADADAVRRLRGEWRQVAFVLDGHHRHEDLFCERLIRRHAPGLLPEIEAAHRRCDAAIAQLHRLAGRLARADTHDSGALLRLFYLDLGDFTSMYLAHLRDEEDRVMPALNAAMSNDELAAVTAAIRGSVTPEDMCIFIRYMVPSMNFAERLDMLGGMHAGAPPAVFEMFRRAAEGVLAAKEYARVAQAAGFAINEATLDR
jgi:hypothetical protein